MESVLSFDLPTLPKLRSGKVRELFDLGSSLLMVATDRISAFDVVMGEGVPDKGRVLTQLSKFWFDKTRAWMPNHLIRCDPPAALAADPRLAGRCMEVVKAQPLAIECVVRGYLSGSGWKEYRTSGTLAGERLPSGLEESEALPAPRFTPATKAESGHDENITRAQAADIVGKGLFEEVERRSLQLYQFAHDHARQQGLILADTKFEFGLYEGDLILIDEVLTPDSSRYWPADGYRPGRGQPSFDKQFLRDYLELLDWPKTPPPPALPPEVIARTADKYREAYARITGQTLSVRAS
jgi:phosphoribosylaminoimidazole-succinocarboxamide synthase